MGELRSHPGTQQAGALQRMSQCGKMVLATVRRDEMLGTAATIGAMERRTMNSQIRFVVNDQEFTTQTSEQSVAELLDRVGLTTDQAVILGRDGVAHTIPDELIEVHNGDRFEARRCDDMPTRGRVIHYEVNGERQTTTGRDLTMGAILERAGRAASIDPDHLGDYYLQNLESGRRYDDLAERVVVQDGDRFLAVHRGATPVA